MLTAEQREVLIDLLTRAIADVSEEIYKTENYAWRQDLHRREVLLREILAQLEESAPEQKSRG